jgi:hypothetical protein
VHWIGTQSTTAIALIVCALCYGIAAVVFGATRLLSGRRIAHDLQAITPVLLTPMAVIGGLLIAFLAARTWSNLDRAYGFSAQEANAVWELDRLSHELPPPVDGVLRGGVRTYIAWVTSEDWPKMVAGQTSISPVPPGLKEVMDAIAAADPAAAGQQAILESALATAERVLEARRNRVLLSAQVIDASQWTVVWLFYVLLIIVLSFIHLDRPLTQAVATWLFSSAFALCLVLLVLYDGPFSIGGHTLGPTLLTALPED